MRDLENPIIIDLPRHPNAEHRTLPAHRRLRRGQEGATTEQVEECVYFNHTDEAWSTEGCSLAEVSIDTLKCSCDHLSDFSSAFGRVSFFLTDVVCPNVVILSSDGFANLGKGPWAQQRGGIVLWILLTVNLAISSMACWSQGSHPLCNIVLADMTIPWYFEILTRLGAIFKWLTPFRRPPEGVRACDDPGSHLVAFGPTRHRARAVGQKLFGCLWGYLGMPLRGPLEGS